MRIVAIAILLGTTLAGADAPKKPAPKPPKVTSISWEVEHEPDGKRHPNQVKESYQLDAHGTLHYGAYFGGMPTDFNHNDSKDWAAGAAGKRVLETVARVAGDLADQPDSAPVPNEGLEVYIVNFTGDDGDTTRVAADHAGKAWKAIDPAFVALIASFEKATGRPLKPSQLPQQH